MQALSNGVTVLTLAIDEVFQPAREHLANLPRMFGNRRGRSKTAFCRPAWSRSRPRTISASSTAHCGNPVLPRYQERWPSGDPFVRHAFFGKYSDLQPNADFRNDGNRRRSPSMEYFWTFAGTRQRCRVEVSPSKGFASQKGQMVFNMRLPCHSVGSGARNKVGQELNGLDGHHSGSVPGFDYSDANKNSGIVWNEATFKKYIQNPQGVDSRHKNDLLGR
jgi:cytochrome c2